MTLIFPSSLVLTTLLGLAACGPTEVIGHEKPTSCALSEYAGDAALTSVSVATFWTDPREKLALDSLAERLRHLGYAMTRMERRDREDQIITLVDWIERGGELPDVYQANAGSDVLQLVVADDPDESAVCSLNRLERRYQWRDRYFSAAIDPCTCQRELYALPLGVHRLNVLFYNTELFERARQRGAELDQEIVDPSELGSVEEFLNLLEQIAQWSLADDEGDPVTPLALGNESSWPILIAAFENLLAAYPDHVYEALWQGPAGAAESDVLPAALGRLASDLRRLGAMSNLDERISWQTAVERVAKGRALFSIMGDWAWAQVPDGLQGRVAAVPFPGTQGTYVYTPDTFAVPRVDDSGASAHLWLREVVDNRATQLAFAKVKHSIPAVVDLDDAALDELGSEYLRRSYREFSACQHPGTDCRLLLAVSGLGPAPGFDPCFDELGLLLSQIAGWSAWDDTESRCFENVPANSAEAEEAMTEILLRVSQQRFAEACRR